MTVLPLPDVRPAGVRLALGRRTVTLALVAILLVAGGLRVSQALAGAGARSPDERAYATLAADLARDGSYGRTMQRPFHWPPGAPLAFAAADRILPGGVETAAYATQAMAGVLLVLVVFGLGLLASGAAAGLLAAAVVAIYPPLAGLGGTLLSEPVGGLLLASATLATLWAVRGARPGWWLAGALWGLAILTRADFLLAPVLVAAAIGFYAHRHGDRRLRRGAVALVAGAVLVVAPWSVVATQRAGTPVPVTTGSGAALFVGTYLPGRGTTFGAKRVFADEMRAADERFVGQPVSALPAGLMLDVVAARHPRLDREAALQREARINLARYPLGDPVGFVGMTADKLGRMWLVPSGVGTFATPGWVRVLHVGLVVGCLLLVGLALRRRRRLTLLILIAPALYATSIHAVMVANPRYALAVLPLLVVAGAVAAAELLQRRARGSGVPSAA